MRLKILFAICSVILLVSLALIVSTVETQRQEIDHLRERLDNVEIIVHRELIPVRQESTKQHRHPEIAI